MPIGFTAGRIDDASRADWNGTGSRPISWAAWYPVSADFAEPPSRTGGPAHDWAAIEHVAQNAYPTPSERGLPVVLVSHGPGGTAMGLEWLARRLAERGFVVLAANHHGNTDVEPYRAEGFVCWWERARDLTVLLDHLTADARFAGSLDEDRVFVVGFSLGCRTALSLLGGITDMDRFRRWAERTGGPLARGPREFPDLADRFPAILAGSASAQASWQRQALSYRDARVRAGLLLAPAPPVRAFTDESLTGLRAPIHMIVGDDDTEAPPEHGTEWLRDRLPNASVERLGPGIGHYDLLPECSLAAGTEPPMLCSDTSRTKRQHIHDTVAWAALRVFDKVLISEHHSTS